MISSLKMVFPLLLLVILGCDWVDRDDIANFPTDQGFQNLPEIFVSEEIEVRQLNWLSKSDRLVNKDNRCSDLDSEMSRSR